MSETPKKLKKRCNGCTYAGLCATVGIEETFKRNNIWVCGMCGVWKGTEGRKVPVPKCDPLARRYAKTGMICPECFSGFKMQKLQE